MKTSELLSISAMLVADKDAVVFEGKRFTYGQIQDRVNKAANALQALGIKKGDRIAIIQTNCNEYLETYYATSKLGVIFVPVNYRAKAEELTFQLNYSEAVAILTGDRYVPLINQARANLTTVKHFIAIENPQPGYLSYNDLIAKAPADDIDVPVDDNDTTILMYTAGTTGTPKGVMLSHQSFTSYILQNVSPADPTNDEVNLLTTPLYHVAGAQAMLSSIYAGRTIVLLRQFEAGEWLKTVEAEKATHCILVPTMLRQVIDHPDFHKYDLSSLRQITYGAASMPLDTIKKAVELFPKVRFMNAFGQTETASTVTVLGPEDHVIEGTPEEKEKKLKRLAMSIGKAMPDVEVKIFDEDGKELPPGEVGEIVVRGARVMSGYWKSPEATNATLKNGWIYTGDLGWMDEEGYFFLSGRAKDIIIRGGENISPEEVEKAVGSHPAVEEAAVIGVPDPVWGEAIMAVVILKKGHKATEEEIIEHCRQSLASFKKPERIAFVEDLPRNAMGKVMRRSLRETYGAQKQPATT